jgi:hypothetical protein
MSLTPTRAVELLQSGNTDSVKCLGMHIRAGVHTEGFRVVKDSEVCGAYRRQNCCSGNSRLSVNVQHSQGLHG